MVLLLLIRLSMPLGFTYVFGEALSLLTNWWILQIRRSTPRSQIRFSELLNPPDFWLFACFACFGILPDLACLLGH